MGVDFIHFTDEAIRLHGSGRGFQLCGHNVDDKSIQVPLSQSVITQGGGREIVTFLK